MPVFNMISSYVKALSEILPENKKGNAYQAYALPETLHGHFQFAPERYCLSQATSE
jgi:hypothetical protein